MNRYGEITMTKITGSIILAIIITGCQTTSGGVRVIGPDTFQITKQAHNIFGGGAPAAEQSANEEAQKKCASQNKQLLVKQSRTRFERPFYRNSIVFRCLSEDDREYKRPKIRSSGRIRNQQNVIIQNNGANAGRSLPQKSTKSTLVEKDDWRFLVQTKLESDWRVLIKQKDYLAAYQLLQAPVDQKKPDALFLLGKMHDKGHGVPKDKKKSFGYFLEAAKQGHPSAMARIGSAYRTKNSGTDRNAAQSYYWTKKAAEMGYPAAWFNLAQNYANGVGVSRNIENAHMWLNLMNKYKPSPFLKKFLKKFERRMDSEQIWALEKRANNCIQLQYKGCSGNNQSTVVSNASASVDKITLPLKMDWEGVADNMKGMITVPDLTKWKNPEVPVDLKLPSFTCTGSSIARSGNWSKGEIARGVFTLKCTNNRILTGTYTSPKAGEGIGRGKDDTGSNIMFLYGSGAT